MKLCVALIALVASGFAHAAVEWDFPRLGNCHEGMAFSDGVTGVLAWGGGDTLNLTVGRADLWENQYHARMFFAVGSSRRLSVERRAELY